DRDRREVLGARERPIESVEDLSPHGRHHLDARPLLGVGLLLPAPFLDHLDVEEPTQETDEHAEQDREPDDRADLEAGGAAVRGAHRGAAFAADAVVGPTVGIVERAGGARGRSATQDATVADVTTFHVLGYLRAES